MHCSILASMLKSDPDFSDPDSSDPDFCDPEYSGQGIGNCGDLLSRKWRSAYMDYSVPELCVWGFGCNGIEQSTILVYCERDL